MDSKVCAEIKIAPMMPAIIYAAGAGMPA